ncbi:MAG: hypothetical protein ABI609_12100 [Acidobacteriota bacterium]
MPEGSGIPAPGPLRGFLSSLRTLAWLRWRLITGALARRNRGRLEQISSTLSLVLRIVLGLAATGFAVALTIGAVIAALHYDRPEARKFFALVSGFLFSLALVFTAIFAGNSGTGEMLSSSRLQLLPLKRSTLHRLQVAAALGDPMVLALVPALVAFGLTLLVRGQLAVGAVALGAGLLVMLFLAAFACAIAGVLQLLLRGRRRREVFLLLVAVGFASLSLGPSLLGLHTHTAGKPSPDDERVLRLRFRTLTENAPWAPPVLYARAVESASTEGLGGAAPALLGLALCGGLAYAVSSAAARRLHASPATNARTSSATGEALGRLPFLSSAVGTLAMAQWRSLSRTTLARMGFLMTPLMTFVIARGLGNIATYAGHWAAAPAALAAIAGPLTLIGLNQIVVNQFAFDGHGLARQVLLPVSATELVAARRASSLLFALGVGLPTLFVAALAGPRVSPLVFVLVALGTVGVARVCLPCALLLSAMLPKTVDPSRLGRASQPHQGAVLLWMPLVAAVTAPIWLAGWLLWSHAGPAAALAAAALWVVLATLIARPMERGAAAAFSARREALLLVASGR